MLTNLWTLGRSIPCLLLTSGDDHQSLALLGSLLQQFSLCFHYHKMFYVGAWSSLFVRAHPNSL